MKINKNTIERFHTELNGVLEGIAKKYDLKYIPGFLRYSDVEIRVKTEFVNLENKPEIGAKVMDTPMDAIKAGLGNPGDKFWVIRNEKVVETIIIKARRKKYLVEFDDSNNRYIVPFERAKTKKECEKRLKVG